MLASLLTSITFICDPYCSQLRYPVAVNTKKQSRLILELSISDVLFCN